MAKPSPSLSIFSFSNPCILAVKYMATTVKTLVLIRTLLFFSIFILGFFFQTSCSGTELSAVRKKTHWLTEHGQIKAALAYLNQLASQEPTNAGVFCERAIVYLKVEQFTKALEDCKRATVLNPKLSEVYTYSAEAYIGMNQCEQALNEANKSILLNPKFARGYYVRAWVYERQRAYQKTVEDCNKAIAINPKVYKYYLLRAIAFLKLEKYEQALQDSNRALNLTGFHKAMPYTLRGYTYTYLGRHQRAVEDCSAAIKIDSNSFDAYSVRANAYGSLGQYQKQIDDMSSASRICPKDAELYGRRGRVYYRLGKLQNAIKDCILATTLNPDLSASYQTAALAFEEQGLYDKAIQFLTKALALDANNVLCMSNRAKIYELLGKSSLAEADWQKVKEKANPSELATIRLCNPLIDMNKFSILRKTDLSSDLNVSEKLNSNSTILSFHYDDSNHICVPVELNQQSLQMMLDTGWAYSSLWEDAKPIIGKMESLRLLGTKANKKEYLFSLFTANNLKLGNLCLKNVAMSVEEGLVKHKNLSGFLAGNILENFVVTVDYLNNRIILASSSRTKESKKAIVVPMILREHRPFCMVRLNDELECIAMLDTGCPFSIAADSLLIPILPKKLSYRHELSGPWLGDLKSAKVSLKKLKLGTSILVPPPIEIFPSKDAPDAATEITLGHDFLSKFKSVTIDYLSRRIIFEPH